MGKYFQRNMRMEEETEAEIQEIATKEGDAWAETAYNLVKSALKERKRQSEKNAKRKTKEVSS